jgi:hypothetical protein
MRWRVIPTLTLVLTMLAAAWLVLRSPDAGQVIVFFNTGIPSLAAGEAVMTLLAWLVVMAAAFATVLGVLQGIRRSRTTRPPASYASLFLVVGLLLFAVGVIRHSLPSSSVCCGSGPVNIREAEDLAR